MSEQQMIIGFVTSQPAQLEAQEASFEPGLPLRSDLFPTYLAPHSNLKPAKLSLNEFHGR